MKRTLTVALLLVVNCLCAQTLPGLDSSFGNRGIVLDSEILGNTKQAYNLLLQPDGKIVISGSALFRYLTSGRPDTTFGVNGQASLPAFTGASSVGPYGNSVHLQSSGKLIVANGLNDSGNIVRYTFSGKIDSSFGTNGTTATPFFELDCSVLQPDGKVLIAGLYKSSNYYVQIDRIKADGGYDSSFGTNGIVRVKNGQFGAGKVAGIAMMADGRIVIGGMGEDSNGVSSAMVMRFLPNGALDTTFNHTGAAYPFSAGLSHAMLLQPDGKTILAVSYLAGNTYISRFNVNGSVDPSFGQGGSLTIAGIQVSTMKYLPDGRILCGANTGDFVLARLKPNGVSLDSSFGKNGIIKTDVTGTTDEWLYAIAVQSDGKIIAAGESHLTTFRITILRYLADAQTVVEQIPKNAIRVFPNPARSAITIDFTQTVVSNADYKVFSLDGRVISAGSLNGNQARIDVSGLIQGTYLLSISSPYFTETHLFTKQ